ncbi:MAG: type II toxin-antitoxin system RelE/ParE family toxin [Promethearchaeota archaeon]|nr:MAG: type II toxin-antitoxin system RelE/ParE family toxin [Candidatus Lokiarchaeota archaeon]
MRRLHEIYNYIARDSKNYANLFMKKLYESAQKLKDFPKIGRIVPELDNPNIREIIFHNYRIIYRNKIQFVEILTIIHGSRLLKI